MQPRSTQSITESLKRAAAFGFTRVLCEILVCKDLHLFLPRLGLKGEDLPGRPGLQTLFSDDSLEDTAAVFTVAALAPFGPSLRP